MSTLLFTFASLFPYFYLDQYPPFLHFLRLVADQYSQNACVNISSPSFPSLPVYTL